MSATLTPIRVYSQNVCVLPLGGRESLLQKSSILGTILVLAAFGAASFFVKPIALATAAVFLLSTSLFCPLGYFMATPYWALSNFYGDDYKAERLAALADRLATKGKKPAYDVVLLQEFFGCFYSDVHRIHFTKLMFERGYKYNACPPCSMKSIFPALWANSGLAVFSPYRVTQPRFQPFRKQLFYDYWLVSRGILSAKVDVNGGIQVVSTHFGPPLSVLSMFKAVPEFLKTKFDVFDAQISDLVQTIRSSPHPSIVGGDFNAAVNGPHYRSLKSALASVDLVNTGLSFEQAGAKPTANPPEEKVLTKGIRAAMVLDYVFASSSLGKSTALVGGMAMKGDGCLEGMCISDHAPVEAEVGVDEDITDCSDEEGVVCDVDSSEERRYGLE
jgi:endonuclease/exonuclease/phosphatase family metal-dependent hydrolase